MMEQEIFESAEQETNEVGRNVKIHIYFLRHGEKAFSTQSGETSLTETGQLQSDEFGKNLDPKMARKAYASDTKRAMETAQRIIDQSNTQKKLIQRVSDNLNFNYDPEGEFYKKNFEIKRQYCGDDFISQSPEEQKKRLMESQKHQQEYYLQFGDKRPDNGTFSPAETAAMMAWRVDTYTRMAGRLAESSNIDLINITHDFNLNAFLKEVIIQDIGGVEKHGFDSLDEIGGGMDYIEGFEIEVETDEKGKEKVKLNLIRQVGGKMQKQEYGINMERLQELAEIGKEMGRKSDD